MGGVFEMMVFDIGANTKLSEEIAETMGIKLGKIDIEHFADGEIAVKVNESVRGMDVFLIQPTCPPVNENLMTLLITVDAIKRASAGRINAVIPYYGYCRQEKKTKGREPITAKLVANLLVTAGVDRVVVFDLHTWAIQGFFDIPVDHFSALPIIAKYFKRKGLSGEEVVVVSPDAGGVARARALAKMLNAGLAIVDKRRPKPNFAEVLNLVGNVEGKKTILVDDMIDTAGTITKGAKMLEKKGAVEVYAAATHPLLSGDAYEKIENSPIKELVVTNTIPLRKKSDKITVLSVASLLSEGIYRIHNNLSVSSLFQIWTSNM